MSFRKIGWLLLAALLSDSASALDPTVFSNRNQPSKLPPFNVSVNIHLNPPKAVPFTTNATDTELKKIKLHITKATTASTFRVKIYDVDNSQSTPKPGQQIATLLGPTNLTQGLRGDVEFYFPAPLTLKPNTSYYVVMEDNTFNAITESSTRIGTASDLVPAKYTLGMPGVSPTTRCQYNRPARDWSCRANALTTTVFPLMDIVAFPPAPPSYSLTANPKIVNFGTVPINTESALETITITNDGAASQTLRGLSVGKGYILKSDNCSNQTLPIAASCAVSVAFAPTSGGLTLGALAIVPDPADPAQQYPVALTGSSSAVYSVGGTLSALAAGSSITLQLNGTDDRTLTGDGAFSFSPLADASVYAVTISAQPTGQICSVMSGTGTLTGSDITNVQVTCTNNNYTIGGQISGIASGNTAVLQNNGGDNLSVGANGSFTFATSLAYLSAYNVSILTQPGAPSETCSVSNNTGTVAAGNVTGVNIACAVNQFSVGGTVSGLSPGESVELKNNGADTVTVASDGTFQFGSTLADNSAYAIAVSRQPTGQSCSVANATGALAGANATNISVTCVNTPYGLGGSLTGLASGDSVILQNNGGDNLTAMANGTFSFPTALNFGDPYAVTVLKQPPAPSETCTVTNGTGTMPAGNVNTVSVACTLNAFSVGGTVTGLAGGDNISLQLNGTDDRTLTGDGSFRFSPLADASVYAVTISAQPSGQTCSVMSGTGTLTGSDITNVQVTCTNNNYTIGGQISGIASGNTAVLQNNGGDNLSVGANGSFTFATSLAYLSAYNVSILTQPGAPSETCSVSNNTGTVAAGNVTGVNIACAVNQFSVGGTVSGLSPGESVELKNNGADTVTVASDGTFQFGSTLADNSAYAIAVSRQPTGQSCSVANATGALAGADVTAIEVICIETPYTIGGGLTGLAAGDSVTLQNIGGDSLVVSANGAFTFPSTLNFGDPYAVTVLKQPPAPSETCTVTNGSGNMPAGNVNTLSVVCTLNAFSVGGTVTGLAGGDNITLQLNGTDDRTLTGDGPFRFSPLADPSAYAVTISAQPPGQTCSVNSGTGTLAGSDITNVTVTCLDNQYTVGGLLTGLVPGDNLVLQNNGGDNLTLAVDGAFAFGTPVDFGDTYRITVLAQPTAPSESCTVKNDSGTMPSKNINNLIVTCSVNTFSVGGSVSGLFPGQTVVLQNNAADDLTVTADGNFVFSAQADGSSYSISVAIAPAGQTCAVTDGTGTLSGADVSRASIACSDAAITPKARPVPLMPVWILALMLLLVAGTASRGLGRLQ